MNKLRSAIEAIVTLRVIGALAIALSFFMVGATMEIFENARCILRAMGENVLSSSSILNYEMKKYASVCANFYVLLALTAFVMVVCWKNKAKKAYKTVAFAIVMSIIIGIVFWQSVLSRMLGDQSGWYYNFWYETLSPIGLVIGYYMMIRLFWSITKPEEDTVTTQATASAT